MLEKKVESECLYRMIGQCKNCTYDFNPDHKPNNLDCPRYKPILAFYVSPHETVVNKK